MRHTWIPRSGGFIAAVLVGAALILLQVSIAADGLIFFLPWYGLIGLAALIALVAVRSGSTADRICLATAALFCGYIALRAVTSPAVYTARADLYALLAGLTVYGLTVTALSSSARRIGLIIALLVFAACHVLVAAIQFGIGHNFIIHPFLESLIAKDRARGFYGNPDHLAGMLEIVGIFGLSIAWWSRWPGWVKVVVGYLAVTAYIGLALTGSRGGYLSAAASLAIFVVLSAVALRSGGAVLFRKYGATGLIVMALALTGGWFLMQQSASIRQRVERITEADHTRFDLWRAAVQQWKLQPLTGTGSGTYKFYGREFRAERMQNDPVVVHNDYLNLLCEYGVIGAVAFLIFFAAHLRYGARTFALFGPRRLAAGILPGSDRLALNIGALSAVGAYIVHSVVDFNMHVPANALLIAFVFGILADSGSRDGETAVGEGNVIPRVATAAVGAVLLLQCIRLWPGEYFAARASIALENEEPPDAVKMATKALVYEKQNPNIYFYLGRALGALAGNSAQSDQRDSYYEQAIAAFDKAHKLVPLDGSYPLDMAFAYDMMGRFAEAEWMYWVARSRDPRSEMMLNMYQTHLEAWRRDGQGAANQDRH